MSIITENFFIFPIKIYDSFSMKKALRKEEQEEDAEFNGGPIPIDWVLGYIRIPATEVLRLVWHDGFSRERTVKEAAEEGFDLTMVFSPSYGDFVCTWPRKKFEEKVGDFLENRKEAGVRSSKNDT